MALTIAAQSVCELPNSHRLVVFRVTFDSSYPSGGETFDISTWFGGSPFMVGASGDDGYVIEHDRGTAAAGKLIARVSGTTDAPLNDEGNATDMSAVIATVTMIGVPTLS